MREFLIAHTARAHVTHVLYRVVMSSAYATIPPVQKLSFWSIAEFI